MNLVEDWREWKRWWSMRWIIVSTFCSAAALAYATLPTDWLPSIPGWMKGALAAGAMFSAGAAGVSRVLVQAPKSGSVPIPTVPRTDRMPPA